MTDPHGYDALHEQYNGAGDMSETRKPPAAVNAERWRRATWLIHNALVTPFIPIRAILFAIYKAGEAAEWIGLRTPGWRRLNGWSGWRNFR